MVDKKNIKVNGEEKSSPAADFNLYMEQLSVARGQLSRHDIRNMLFKLRDRRIFPEEEALANSIFDIFQKQFKPGMGLAGFTFTWDIGVDDPFRLITEDEWEDAGGKYDGELARRNVKLKRPAAFTKQK